MPLTSREPARFLEGETRSVDAFMQRWSGATFSRGLYRIHNRRSGAMADTWVSQMFPEFGRRFQCFGFDWLGRQFALDADRIDGGQAQVLLMDPGTAEALEIPCGFSSFHNQELVEFHDAALATDFFRTWSEGRNDLAALSHDVCVGYKVPLFLGGVDDVSNLELTDMDVYWSLSAQLLADS